MNKLITFASLALLASTSQAFDNSKVVCSHADKTRIIEVVYADGELPCEVQYTKESGTQTLWNAQNDAGYCQQKASAFVEKQRGWGWDCIAQAEAQPAVDDREQALAEDSAMAQEEATTEAETTAPAEAATPAATTEAADVTTSADTDMPADTAAPEATETPAASEAEATTDSNQAATAG